MKRSLLPIYTFVAIFLVIVAVGLATVPVILRWVEAQYLELQSDINQRQAGAFTRFAELRLAEGFSGEEVLHELNAMLAGADADRGFTCIISQDSLEFLFHPMADKIGKPVASVAAELSSVGESTAALPFEDVVASGREGDGLLTMPGGRREVVFLQSIPSVRWTIATHENTERVDRELAGMRRMMIGGFLLLGLLVAVPSSYAARRVGSRYERVIEERNERIQKEQEVSEKLLLNILPATIAAELKGGREIIARHHKEVGVLFADLVGFTPLTARISADQPVCLLDEIFSAFDDLCERYGLEKIKTIGDSYMGFGNLPEPDPEHLEHLAAMALDMITTIRELPSAKGMQLRLRIGMDVGPVTAGVIGNRKFSYDLWGDVVNTASRMESGATPGEVRVTAAVAHALRGKFRFDPLPDAEIKGKGRMSTFRLLEKTTTP